MLDEQEKTGLIGDSRGMASILITMVTMIVVTLIVLGFATISRREQGNTLDKQLSTQAFYAAESAVNDARKVIDAAVAASQPIPGKTSCNTNSDGAGYTPNFPIPAPGTSGVVLDSTNNVSYTCLLVDPTPSALTQDGVGDNAWVVPVNSTSPFDTIKIQWAPSPAVTSGNPVSDCTDTLDTFDAASGSSNDYSCGYGVLRMDLVPTSGPLTGGQTGSLMTSQMTAFFQPLSVAGTGTLAYAPANIGKANVRDAVCSLGSYNICTATITGLSGTSYTLKINSLYKNSNVTVTALSGGSPIATNGQVLVDATGNANGVLRRIQVRLPTSSISGVIPRYAIQSNDSICKRFYVTPSYYANAGDVINPQSNPASKNYNAMCDNALPAVGAP
ncbi:MAG TPA: hypothetical protein VLG47_00240 [Candidatus Saccharimonadales bacterium]|nr:hypothetical protein [Candidatus Saccharimonadales bacterium]